MEIRYERPLPDLTFLVRAPLWLDIGGGQVACIEEWCPDGLRPPPELNGDDGTARLIVPFHGFEIGFPVALKRDAEANLLRFEDLGAREARVLKHFYRELVTGRAVAMDRMITAMDTPTEKVPMTQTPKEQAASKENKGSRPMRVATTLVVYAALVAVLYHPVLSPAWQKAKALSFGLVHNAAEVVAPLEPDPRPGAGLGGADGAGQGGPVLDISWDR